MSVTMDILRRIQKGVRHPGHVIVTLGEVLNRSYHTQFGRYKSNPSADGNILDEDWDNLILLDSCRFDYLQEYSDSLPGPVSKRISPGSQTSEFIRATFANRHETDLVYVTAVPWWARLADEINSTVHYFVNLENEDIQDPELGVELPDVTANRALEIAEKYPDKRLLIHFNQPHYPYIGELGRRVFPTTTRTRVLEDVFRANATREQVQAAYRENLEAVLPEVNRLVDELVGKTVITADHGEMLGERGWPIPIRDYGHTDGIYTEKLEEVPWVECPYETRKEIIDSDSVNHSVDTKTAEDRLKQLGYM